MQVFLLTHTPDPLKTVAMAAKLCYSPSKIAELAERVEGEDQAGFVDKIISMGHLSVLEHAVFTFGVEGISRATSHQLVRHRVASYSQQSQRYVKVGESFEHVVPHTVSGDGELLRKFEDAVSMIHEVYGELVDAGVPAEDARYLLPNAAATKIIITMNARELLHFFSIRCCERAQWEIRDMSVEMLKLAMKAAPAFFRNSGPGCVRGKCTEGAMTCGNADEVRKRFSQLL